MTLIIKDWDKIFENSHSRKVADLTWVRFPNKHDGAGLRRLGKRKDGSKVFCAFIFMVQIASKCPKRGALCKDGRDLTPDDFNLKTGFPKKMFENAIPILKSKEIGWVVESNSIPVESGSTRCPAVKSSKVKKREEECAASHPDSGKNPDDRPSPEDWKEYNKRLKTGGA